MQLYNKLDTFSHTIANKIHLKSFLNCSRYLLRFIISYFLRARSLLVPLHSAFHFVFLAVYRKSQFVCIAPLLSFFLRIIFGMICSDCTIKYRQSLFTWQIITSIYLMCFAIPNIARAQMKNKLLPLH